MRDDAVLLKGARQAAEAALAELERFGERELAKRVRRALRVGRFQGLANVLGLVGPQLDALGREECERRERALWAEEARLLEVEVWAAGLVPA